MSDQPSGAEAPSEEVPIDLDAPAVVEDNKVVQLPGATESPEGADAAPAQEQPSGEAEETEPAELPPIEPPKSWTKAEQEEFAAYPRDAQEKIARREQERDAETRRGQNEAAELKKGLTAKEQAVEQARQQYETALPILLQNLQGVMAGEFSDIKTMPDVQKMANEDWPRYIRWDAQQKQLASVQQEITVAQHRQSQERQQQWTQFASAEDEAFKAKVPEMADPKRAAELQSSALNVLKELGFKESELGESWNGVKDLSLRDHRLQLLIRDAIQWREAQSKAKTAQPKPQPRPQTAGTGAAKGSVVDLATAADRGDMSTYFAMRAKGAKR